MNGGWKMEKLNYLLSPDMVEHITLSIKPPLDKFSSDLPVQMLSSDGKFSTKSAFELVRSRRHKISWMDFLWAKGLPFKISFFLWRCWRRRIPADDNLQRMHISLVSRCHCCKEGYQESMTYLFLTSSCTGININGMLLQQLIHSWWKENSNPKVQKILKIVPMVIMWEIWKKRNARRYDKDMSFYRLRYQCQQTIYLYLRKNFPWINCSRDWPDILKTLQNYRLRLHCYHVGWKVPEDRWIK